MIGLVQLLVGVGLIVWGAETFAEHLAAASRRLGVTTFALAVLLAGAEPEELATAIAAGLRHAPAIAFGDVIGANVAICLVALPVAAWLAPLSISGSARRYALLAIPAGLVAAAVAWDGSVSRVEGWLLVACYVGYVGVIWWRERRPPELGEVAELNEIDDDDDHDDGDDDGGDDDGGADGTSKTRVPATGRDLVLVLAGTAAIVVGAALLVEAVRRLTSIEAEQTKWSLTLVGFATAFELVVLAWSAGRRGMADTVVAAVVGSFAYNSTMTLGAAAVITPLHISDAASLHAPFVAMIVSLVAVLALSARRRRLGRTDAAILLVGYGVFIAITLI